MLLAGWGFAAGVDSRCRRPVSQFVACTVMSPLLAADHAGYRLPRPVSDMPTTPVSRVSVVIKQQHRQCRHRSQGFSHGDRCWIGCLTLTVGRLLGGVTVGWLTVTIGATMALGFRRGELVSTSLYQQQFRAMSAGSRTGTSVPPYPHYQPVFRVQHHGR